MTPFRSAGEILRFMSYLAPYCASGPRPRQSTGLGDPLSEQRRRVDHELATLPRLNVISL